MSTTNIGFRDDSETEAPQYITLRVPLYIDVPLDNFNPEDPDPDDLKEILEEVRIQVDMADSCDFAKMIVREGAST